MTFRRTLIILAALALLASACQQTPAPKEKLKLTNEAQEISYSIGMDIGSKLAEQEIELDPEYIAQGIMDSYAGETLITPDESREILLSLQQRLMQEQAEKETKVAEENLKKSEAFLAEKAKEEGVVVLPSGLMYKIDTEGDGPKPTEDDTVVVEYTGTLIDGTEFDSTARRGQPATFPLKGVIPGWTEALQLMPVGSKWTIYLPPDLAYGDRKVGNMIEPNSALIFNIELKEIKPPEAEAQPEAAAEGQAQ